VLYQNRRWLPISPAGTSTARSTTGRQPAHPEAASPATSTAPAAISAAPPTIDPPVSRIAADTEYAVDDLQAGLADLAQNAFLLFLPFGILVR